MVLDGNPLDTIETVLEGVALVMKGGTIVRDDIGDGRTDLDRHSVSAVAPSA